MSAPLSSLATAATPSTPTATGLGSAIEPLRQPLWRYLCVLGCDATTAEDLVQDAFVIALRRASFDASSPRATFAFLRTTARQLWLTSRRRRASLRDIEEGDAVWDRHCGDDLGDERLARLRACMAALPERSRELLAAAYGEELGRAACARRFGLSADGVKSALRRLRAALRACIERDRMEDGR